MEKDLEYTKMACYYDELYKNKDYEKEIQRMDGPEQHGVLGPRRRDVYEPRCGIYTHRAGFVCGPAGLCG
jgi:hypothetical protein